ncbi:hypothetical protein ACI65C_013164 [Semiaphis heraclei]
MPTVVVTGNGNQGSIPEREPEKRLPHPRKAAGAQITHSRNGESDLCLGGAGPPWRSGVSRPVVSRDHVSRRRGRRRARQPSRGVSYRHVGRTYCRQADTCLVLPARHAATRRAAVGVDDGGRLLQSCCAVLFTECRRRADTFTLNKLECSKQAQIWRGGFTAVSSKGPEYWSHGIMEQDLGPAHLRPSRAREIALRGVSVRGPPGRGRQSPARPAGPVFGTGGNDQQRRAGAFVPRR